MQFGVSEGIAHWGKYRPNAPALTANGICLSYRQLNAKIDGLCYQLRDLVEPYERIGILISSKATFLIAVLASIRLGKAVVLLNPRVSPAALTTQMGDTHPGFLLYEESTSHAIPALAPPLSDTLCLNDSLAAFEHADVSFPTVERGLSDEWGVLFSSGTTGISKGSERDHYSIVTELLGWILELTLSRRTSFYVGRPVFYTGGLVVSLSVLLIGGEIIVNDVDDENDSPSIWNNYQECVSARSVSWAFFVPDQIRAFCRLAAEWSAPVGAAESILVMGARISGEEKLAAHRVLRSEIVESWGNTEGLGTITDPQDLALRADSVGRPFLGDVLLIVDDDGLELQPLQDGRIAGNEEAGFNRYANRPAETSQVKRKGLLISDDIGYVNSEGYFYVRGRVQETVNLAGTVLYLPQLEEHLRKHGDIDDACVVARPISEDQMELVALVVWRDPSSVDEGLAIEMAEAFALPVEVIRIIAGEKVPRLPSGKVDRTAVAESVQP